MQRPRAETSLGSCAVSIFQPCASQRNVPRKALSTIMSNVVGTCWEVRDSGTAKPFICFPLNSRKRGTSCMERCLGHNSKKYSRTINLRFQINTSYTQVYPQKNHPGGWKKPKGKRHTLLSVAFPAGTKVEWHSLFLQFNRSMNDFYRPTGRRKKDKKNMPAAIASVAVTILFVHFIPDPVSCLSLIA